MKRHDLVEAMGFLCMAETDDGPWVEYAEAKSDAELIKRLNASLAEARADRDRLREALKGLMPWVVTDVLENCDGNKCRELWCAGCFGDDEAEANVVKARQARDIARKALEGEGK